MIPKRPFQGRDVPWIVTIGCDPGGTSGLAVWVWDSLVHVATVRNKRYEAGRRSRALRDATASLGIADPTGMLFVAEAQFMPREREDKTRLDAKRVPSVLKTAENAARWEELALLLGIPVEKRTSQQTWRSMFGLASPNLANKSQEALKLVRERGVRCDSADAAEAVLIGLNTHVQRIAKFQQRLPEELSRWVAYKWRKSNDRAATGRGRGDAGRGARRSRYGRRDEGGKQGTFLP